MQKTLSIIFILTAFLGGVQAQNVSPQANLDLSNEVVRLGEILRYDASNSRDGQGQARNLEYRFQFSNRSPWTSFGNVSRGDFSPTQTGDNIFRLEIRDRNTGATQRTFRQYTVREERSPNPPRIKLLSQPPFSAGEQIGFEVIIIAEPSLNKNDIQVRWDFNSDGTFDTQFRTDKKGFFTYPGGNLVSPTVQVQFPGGRTLTRRGILNDLRTRAGFDFDRDTDVLRINPTRIQAPIVNVSPGTTSATQETVFTFDASRTPLGSNSFIEFFFDGVKKHSGKSEIKHQFQSPGEHTVRVTHCINRQNPECRTTEVRVDVADSSDSTGTGFWADFTPTEILDGVNRFRINDTTYQAVVSSPIRFTGEANLVSVGRRPDFEYRWDFEGNGVWDTPFSSSISSEYTYDNKGHFKPTLEIRDDRGNTTTAVKNLIVLKNTKPLGRIRTATWPNYAGQELQFQVEVIDKESSVSQLDVRFDFDGDGVWDTDFRPSRSQRWRFDAAGEYNVTIQIRDPQKEVTTVTRVFPILETPPPEPKVQVSHRTQTVGQPIRLDATKSLGEGLQYEWRVVNDPYAPVRQGIQTNLSFDTPGERIICLHVIDQAGNIKDITFPIMITAEAIEKNTPKAGGGTSPAVAGAIDKFEEASGEFQWSDEALINRPSWQLTGMRPGF